MSKLRDEAEQWAFANGWSPDNCSDAVQGFIGGRETIPKDARIAELEAQLESAREDFRFKCKRNGTNVIRADKAEQALASLQSQLDSALAQIEEMRRVLSEISGSTRFEKTSAITRQLAMMQDIAREALSPSAPNRVEEELDALRAIQVNADSFHHVAASATPHEGDNTVVKIPAAWIRSMGKLLRAYDEKFGGGGG